jgi:hypothetical protein
MLIGEALPVRSLGKVDDPRSLPMTLWLGYEDDAYDDNGYYAHDDATEAQCHGTGAAQLRITIEHPQTVFKKAMLVSNRNRNLAVNAWGSAMHGTVLWLHSGCRPENPDCSRQNLSVRP